MFLPEKTDHREQEKANKKNEAEKYRKKKMRKKLREKVSKKKRKKHLLGRRARLVFPSNTHTRLILLPVKMPEREPHQMETLCLPPPDEASRYR